jgi:transposase
METRMRAPSRHPKRSLAEWAALRQQALVLFGQGMSIRQVAAALTIGYETARTWCRKLERGGPEAVCAAKPRGRKPRLSAGQLVQLEEVLLEGPQQQGYKTDVWTLERIADLIGKRFGVRYHPSHVFKILQALGWSCQRPTRQAKERDEAAIAQWLREDWPRIKRGQSATARP